LVGIEDKIADVSYEVKTKVLPKMDQEERQSAHENCFEVPNFMVEQSHGVGLPDNDMVIISSLNETTSSLRGDLEVREAYEKLKKMIRKQYILRKGDIVTKTINSSPKSIKWELTSSNDTLGEDIDKNPVTHYRWSY
jgi:hypothetical protein